MPAAAGALRTRPQGAVGGYCDRMKTCRDNAGLRILVDRLKLPLGANTFVNNGVYCARGRATFVLPSTTY